MICYHAVRLGQIAQSFQIDAHGKCLQIKEDCSGIFLLAGILGGILHTSSITTMRADFLTETG